MTPTILVLVEDDAPLDHSRLVGLAEHGWRFGVYVLWLAHEVTSLPAACRTFVEVGHAHDLGAVGYVHSGTRVDPVALELLQEADADRLARILAPIVDRGARIDDDSDLPRAVSLLSLTGPHLASSPDAVLERWAENRSILTGPYAPAEPVRRAGSLRAVIGQAAGEMHALDLRTDGPHALVGGTTGSGKSELLQTWILSMAAAHSPQRLTFLLVDYKGGSAFRDCVELPHTVGLVTDLSPHLVRRALTSLSAELRYREHVLARHLAKDLMTLERQGVPDAPPSLVIVVDEFAALVQEVPEFVDGVVNVAQRGRSLGLTSHSRDSAPCRCYQGQPAGEHEPSRRSSGCGRTGQHGRSRVAAGRVLRPGVAWTFRVEDGPGPTRSVPSRVRRRLDKGSAATA